MFSGLCNYKYSITNKDSLTHTINIGAYLNSTLITPISTREITYTTKRIDYNYCLEYGEVPDDKNGEKSIQCIKNELRTIQEQILSYGTPIKNETFDALTKGFTTTATSARTPTTTNITQLNQTTLLPGETKYFLITFKPIKRTGELILVAKSDTDFTVRSSLDPIWGFSLVDDFEDNDYTNNPTWILSIGGGASVSTTTAYSPTHSLKITNNGNRVTTSLAGLPADNNYTTWMYPTGGQLLFGVEIDTNVWANGSFRTGYFSNLLQTSICDGASVSTGISMPANVWYKLTIHYNTGDANAFYYLQDANGAYRGSYTHAMGGCSFTPGTVELYMNLGEGYFDDVIYGGAQTDANITWNILDSVTSNHLTNVTIDWNVNAYDLSGQNSPITQDVNTGNYLVSFSKTGYDNNNNYALTAISNKTVTIYLQDANTVTLGTTTLSLFKTSGQFIKGTGNISTTITATGGGIDTSACEYTTNNGATWLAADGNATHCYKNGITITDAVKYDFNIRGRNLGGKLGYATKSSTYYGDLTKPTIDFNYTTTIDSNIATLTLQCWDTNTYCDTITYKIDSGDYNYFDGNYTRFNYVGAGLHTITYYASDALDNNSTASTEDVNMPIQLTVLYPKNEATNNQITEKWNLSVTGGTTASYTDLNASQILYLSLNTAYTLTVVDSNGNYFSRTYTKDYNGFVSTDTLQPYLVSSTTGLLTTINTIDSLSLIPIPSIGLKIYLNSPTLGRTLVEELTTDDKGQALALLVLNSSYDFEIYQNSTLLRTDAITATSNTIYVKIPVSSGLDRNFTYYSINTVFNPFRSKLITSDTNLKQIITLTNSGTSAVTISSIKIWVTNEDINGLSDNDRNLYLHLFSSPTSPFTNGVVINNTTKTIDGNKYDTNGALNVYVYVTLSDGNTFLYFYKYSLPGVKSLKEGMSIDVKGFFGCSTSDPLIPCGGLLLVSLFLALIFTIGLAIEVGATSMEAMGIMFLAFMGLFTFFEWVPYLLYGLMIITFIVIEVAMGGNRI